MQYKSLVVFWVAVFCVICFIFLHTGCSVNDKTLTKTELQHEMYFARQNTIVDISEKESQTIINTFKIEVPSSESKLYVNTFSKIYIADWQEAYLIEIVNICDRNALYEINYNNNDRSPNLFLPHFWNQKDENGDYRYYFAFYVCDDFPLSEYTKEISKLYDNIKATRP